MGVRGISALGGGGCRCWLWRSCWRKRAANTGGGGGGASCGLTTAQVTGSGGGSGGFIDAIITSPLRTYAYSVGYGGTGGSAGTNGYPGGAGGSSLVEVTEYYQ